MKQRDSDELLTSLDLLRLEAQKDLEAIDRVSALVASQEIEKEKVKPLPPPITVNRPAFKVVPPKAIVADPNKPSEWGMTYVQRVDNARSMLRLGVLPSTIQAAHGQAVYDEAFQLEKSSEDAG